MNPDRDTLQTLIRDELAGWIPPGPDPVEEAAAVAELNEAFGFGPDDDPDDLWTVERLRDARAFYEPADDDEARDRLASSVAADVRDLLDRPNPGNWRRWPITARVLSKAYVLGIIDGYSTRGDWVETRHIGWKPGPRPYLLGLSKTARTCLRDQVRYATPRRYWPWRPPGGFHRPGSADVWGICGRCLPWHCCGSTTTVHAPGCPEDA